MSIKNKTSACCINFKERSSILDEQKKAFRKFLVSFLYQCVDIRFKYFVSCISCFFIFCLSYAGVVGLNNELNMYTPQEVFKWYSVWFLLLLLNMEPPTYLRLSKICWFRFILMCLSLSISRSFLCKFTWVEMMKWAEEKDGIVCFFHT